MRQARNLTWALALLAAQCGWAAGVDDPGLTAVRGTATIAIEVSLGSAASPGTALLCRARVEPNLQGFGGQGRGAFPAGWTAGVGRAAGGAGICTVEVPYAWAVTAAAGGAVLRYEVELAPEQGAVQTRAGAAALDAGGAARVQVRVAF